MHGQLGGVASVGWPHKDHGNAHRDEENFEFEINVLIFKSFGNIIFRRSTALFIYVYSVRYGMMPNISTS